MEGEVSVTVDIERAWDQLGMPEVEVEVVRWWWIRKVDEIVERMTRMMK